MEKLHCISAATLLHESIRRELQDYLRPMANDDDLVWQQMTFQNFATLIKEKHLYMKAYGEYSDYDEMKLRDFSNQHFLKEKDKAFKTDIIETAIAELQKAYEEFEKKLFISCWYNSPDLSDVVFKIYAKGNSGIAIGTKIGTLRKRLCAGQKKYNANLEKDNPNNPIHNIVCANVQYIPQKDMRDRELFEPAQVYAPVFMKGLQFKMDNEFRVCVEKKSPEDLLYYSKENRDKTEKWLAAKAEDLRSFHAGTKITIMEHMKQIETEYEKFDQQLREHTEPKHIFVPVSPLSKLIKYIAIKDDSWFQKLGVDGIKDFFKYWFDIEMEHNDKEHKNNGFLVFKVTNIGENNHV